MIRVARLLPLSLGVLLACDGAATTSPSLSADVAEINDVVAELQGIDVQPLGWLDKAMVNVATAQPVTVAVMNDPDFFSTVDLESVQFFGAAPLHFELDLSAYGNGDVVPMCLTGQFADGSAFPADWCEDVTVMSNGSGNHGGGPGR
ncbi:MAG: hypothetical protein P8Z36_09095 [Gemmatimonadota bacterium]